MFAEAQACLLNGVPMPWMGDWGTAYPLFIDHAKRNRIVDLDGHTYLDFCLGDTGTMFGHSPEATAAAVTDQVRRGITTMMPSEDALWVGRDLGQRFGLPFWQVAMTATEANRGFIITPFHNMMLVPPVASDNDIDRLVEAWDACLGEIARLAGS